MIGPETETQEEADSPLQMRSAFAFGACSVCFVAERKMKFDWRNFVLTSFPFRFRFRDDQKLPPSPKMGLPSSHVL